LTIFILLLLTGLFLFLIGIIFFFAPGLLVKWNALGNIWIGAAEKAAEHTNAARRFLAINYAIFTRHRVTGLVLCGFSIVLIAIYVVYH